MRTGISNMPLHGGHCPPWLFAKMKQLGSAIIEVIVTEYGTEEALKRLADPLWFQTLGCVLGFDWHSSGLTTVLCGALKEGTQEIQRELGLFFAGGKGKVSRQTPVEIEKAGDRHALANDLDSLKKTSRMVAKVDSAAVQDGYQLYHHFFIFDYRGKWAVVQQGMNTVTRYARRYHWLSDSVKSFVDDPHYGICGNKETKVLNLVSHENIAIRKASVELCHQNPQDFNAIWKKINNSYPTVKISKQLSQLSLWEGDCQNITMPSYHHIPRSGYLDKILYKLYAKPPQEYENLLEEPGIGPGTLRALAMVAEVTHGVAASYQDPVRYAFAHGGKDGYPFFVQRQDYEHSIGVLKKALEKGKIGSNEKLYALRRLAGLDKNMTQLIEKEENKFEIECRAGHDNQQIVQ